MQWGGGFDKRLVIGASATPHCCRNISKTHLPVTWMVIHNAQITSGIFRDWVTSLNHTCGCCILLLVDNAQWNPQDLWLSNTKIGFLPANAMVSPAPLDLGIINSFKVQYHTHLLTAVLVKEYSRSRDSDTAMSVTQLDACH